MTEKVLKKIELRNEARKQKDFLTADKIRDELLEENISLLDATDKTFWQFLN